MSNQIEDGGPAFPVIGAPNAPEYFPGMSIRDYFAGQALAGCLADAEMVNDCFYKSEEAGITLEGGISNWSYKFADAMISARKGTP